MKCYICNNDLDVGKCIVCGKVVCYEKHAELFSFDLRVSSDTGEYLKNGEYTMALYCCLDAHSSQEIRSAFQKELPDFANILEYLD